MEGMVIRLRGGVKRRFERLMRKSRDAHYVNRIRCVVFRSRGYSYRRIAWIVGCSPSNVSKVVHRFAEKGEAGLIDARIGNGEPRLTEEVAEKLTEYVDGSPQDYGWFRTTWTLELFCLQIENDLGESFSSTTMSKYLKILNACKKRPKPFVKCPWRAEERTRALGKIERLKRSLGSDEVLLYMDEADVHLNPKIGPDWMFKGVQKKVCTPGNNQKRCLAGALNPVTGNIVWIIGQRRNSALFIEFLIHLYKSYRRHRRIHLVVDNCSAHSSKIVNRYIESLDGRIVLHFLPPYCPDENPIERLWKQLHDNVTRNHTCATMDELLDNVEHFLINAIPFPGAHPSIARAA